MRRAKFRVMAGAALAAGALVAVPAARAETVSFNSTGAEQTFTVPAGVTSIDVVAVGAKGGAGASMPGRSGGVGGFGGKASGTIAVTPGQTLFVNVGGNGVGATNQSPGAGGFNGGGAGGQSDTGACGPASGGGAGGGGATDIRTVSRTDANSLASRLVVAGGGGGGGGAAGDADTSGEPGAAGGAAGTAGANAASANAGTGGGFGGAGATPVAPGGNGGFGVGGNATRASGAVACGAGGGGGAGAGAFGGGGGQYGGTTAKGFTKAGGGGGGGSSAFAGGVTNTSATADTTGVPQVTLTFEADAPPPPSAEFTFGTLTRDKTRGTATQEVDVPSAGTLTVGGTGVKPQTVTAADAGPISALIKATGNKKRKLKRKGEVIVTPTFTFTPTDGTATEQSKPISLKRK